MEGRPRPAEGSTRDRLTLQLAISVRGQLQICNSAPLHAGPILPRSTRLAELYLARRGYDGAASAQPRVVTDRRATRNNSQDQSTRKGNQEWHCPRRQELQHVLGLAIKLTLRASRGRGSVTLVGYTRTQRSC